MSCLFMQRLLGTLQTAAAAWLCVCAPSLAQDLGGQLADPARVIGRDTCKICHQSEFAAWEKSSHHTKAWGLLEHPKAKEFAAAVGVADVHSASATCTKCHGTRQAQKDSLTVSAGNSCESCHGGAGGKDGWFQLHFDFGAGRANTRTTKMEDLLKDRAEETGAHRAARDQACNKRGMNRSENPFQLARNCLQCHLVADEKLVAAGHPIKTRFEFVEWSQGEVRHNFLLDPTVNGKAPSNWLDPKRSASERSVEGHLRLMWVAGQLADLEISLRGRAMATTTNRGTLGDEANDRILDVIEELEDLDLDDLASVSAAVKDIDKSSLRKVTDADKKNYQAAADAVRKAAEAFVNSHRDGSQLPQDIKIRDKAKGEPFPG